MQEAIARGLAEIGFADHFPLKKMGYTPVKKVSMEADELDGYLSDIACISRKYTLPVKTGVEVDYIPGVTERVAGYLKQLPLDYVIGSLHFMDGWDFSHPSFTDEFDKRSLRDIYRDYFFLLGEACRSGLFDIIGHIDGIKKFGYRPSRDFLRSVYEQIAEVMAVTGVCLEVNTAGIDAPVAEVYPDPELIHLCRQKGVNLTLGSDAHHPRQVARHFAEIRLLLLDAGVKKLAVFNGRKMMLKDLK